MMHPIEIREQHSNLMAQIDCLLDAAQHMMQAATGLGHPALVLAKTHIEAAAERLTGIAMRLPNA